MSGSKSACPAALAGKLCKDEFCRLTHAVPKCETCGQLFESEQHYKSHLNTHEHHRVAQGTSSSGFSFCSVCKTTVFGDSKCWADHINGSRHVRTANDMGVSPRTVPEQPPADLPGYKFCPTCNKHVVSQAWQSHKKSQSHKARLLFIRYSSLLNEAEKDKHGVKVMGNFDFGIVEPKNAKAGLKSVGSIQTNLPLAKFTVTDAYLASSKGSKTFSAFQLVIQSSNRSLTSKNHLTFNILARQAHLGRCDDQVHFIFQDAQSQTRFMISRPLRIIVGSKTDHDTLKPKVPFKPQKRTAATRQPETNIVEGVAPPALSAIRYVSKLPKFEVPKALTDLLSNRLRDVIDQIQPGHLPSEFNLSTYSCYFKCLLWVEEINMEQDLAYYDIENTQLDRRRSYHFLQVPGLAEKRPSVLVGDSILVQSLTAPSGHWFEGRVHIVRKEEVGLRFHVSFNAPKQLRARFKLNRHPMRRQHLGLEATFAEERVLFPNKKHLPKGKYGYFPSKLLKPVFYNSQIGTNPEQVQAVVSIVYQEPGFVPFIVFGPPGTGKTVTIVEAILQILRREPEARILACAPSNSAADLIASRLKVLPPTALFRLCAPSRAEDKVLKDIRNYVFQDGEGHFSIPPTNRMLGFRVVVSTCVSAAMISGIGVPRGHYSHIFIDEAGQATEPEAMIAIKTLANRETNIVLSGDPRQLGPIIRSTIAKRFGLGKSYIERLMDRELYDEKHARATCLVKLTKNYRSHSSILKFPNEEFYRGDLETCADPNVVNTYLDSSHVAKRGFPIVFYSVLGKDDREASSPSFFNIDEVTQVAKVVKALRSDTRIPIDDDDIGVITPYRGQCLKIQTKLRSIADRVKVGSVEEFQGQEKKVIIISTVRSSQELIEFDLRHTLGFVASARRFNVAVTRAKALLVVVGNPFVLSLDPLWRSFLNYVYNNGGWKGPAPSWDTNEPVGEGQGYADQFRRAAENDMNELTRTLEDMTLLGMEGGPDVDRPWKDTE